ncbi:unnamed protein product [Dictyota dichotoma]|uniref:SecY-independent transporter protein n=1 Tax=Dictyota dichotoma TaxID=2876 RepID=Q2TUC8_DICDH|nr:SecY-independent protein translocase component tatC [Dictyota dichotoma]AAS79068.1 SecY-independent transporter protein [Dictyota dichotoma]
MKQKIKISFYYMQELSYRVAYLIMTIIFIFTITYRYKQTLIYLLLPQGITHIISTDITEIFTTYLHVAALITFMLSTIIIILQIYLFFKPGLYYFEIRILNKYLISYIAGYFYFYIILYPTLIQLSWQFFFAYTLNFNAVQLIFEPRLTTYLTYIKTVGTMLNVLFLIVVLTTLILNYTPTENLVKYRKLIYTGMVLLSTVITPPDCISQIIVTLLLIKLYEIQLFIRLLNKRYTDILN